MSWALPERFHTPDNQAVVDYVAQHPTLSAHDEVAEALTRSTVGLSGVQQYCPDLHRYAYVVLHTARHRIFGLAFGQRALAYRLPQARLAEAVAARGVIDAALGTDWVIFDPWQTNQPMQASYWCKLAYDHAVRS